MGACEKEGAMSAAELISEKDVARAQFWRMGIIAPWYLRRSQLDIYGLLLHEKFPFIEAGRRFGKTNSILAFVLEKLIQNPGWICRWCFPEKNLAMEVLGEEIPKLQMWALPEHQFQFRTMHSVWIHPNGSKLYLRGVNEDRGRSARGPASNIIVCDEYGFWNDPAYIVKDALFPQLENQEGQWLIKASTPPPNLGHQYYIEWEQATRQGRRITKTIFDNDALSEEELQVIIRESGGLESTSFRRERKCEHVSDPKLLIVPEWSDEENIVDDDYPRPGWPVFYMSGDSGADDNTALLFGWYDFENDEEVIEDEWVANGKTTAEIVQIAKAKEAEIWKDAKGEPIRPHRRSYDAQKQLIFDLFGTYEYPVTPALKDDKYSAIHKFRVRVGQRKFKVKRRCVNLCRQLKVGIWKDERHSDFERTEGLGHLDAVAAAIYFGRVIDRQFNPVPLHHGVSHYTHLITPGSPSTGDRNEEALAAIFGRSGRR
jgi:hypothetical protein